MGRTILIDEIHLSIRAPRGLREAEYRTMLQTMDDRRFQSDLRRAIRGVFKRYPALTRTRARLSRSAVHRQAW